MTPREARAEDSTICAEIHIASWRDAFADIVSEEVMTRMTNRDRQEQVYAFAAESSSHHGLLIPAEEPLGMAWYGPARRSEMKDAAELICIHVRKEGQGRGLGRALLEHTLADMKQNGYDRCYLWVFRDNEKARRFYEAMGFVPSAERKSTLEAEEIMYRKEL